ncbi:MAG: hypothetical protein BMS9Abin28_1466 [Anaerolineae bacterium]|nr:MAG: hypothetical protein BMS9Abin28_1466 [Anaerolineae bacterium]
MEQDLRTCPGCGAPAPNHSPCPYCSWTPDLSEEPNLDAIEALGSPPAEDLPDDSQARTYEIGDMLIDAAQEDSPGTEIESENLPEGEAQIEDAGPPETEKAIETDPVQFSELLKPGGEPEHLLEQVPEELRGVLAARLKAAEETERPSFSKNTASNLRRQGYVISEDARGARLAAAPGRSGDLSASDVVKMAADLDGGVQPHTELPICSECQAASPVGETQCQWCGEPFRHGQ